MALEGLQAGAPAICRIEPILIHSGDSFQKGPLSRRGPD